MFYYRVLNGVVVNCLLELAGKAVRMLVIIPEITRVDPHSLDLNLFNYSDELYSMNRIVLLGALHQLPAHTFCLSSLNELVGQVLRSQQSEKGLLEKLVPKRRVRFIFSSIMYKSPTTFMKGCTKVKPHK